MENNKNNEVHVGSSAQQRGKMYLFDLNEVSPSFNHFQVYIYVLSTLIQCKNDQDIYAFMKYMLTKSNT
jgi:hypothetical protein